MRGISPRDVYCPVAESLAPDRAAALCLEQSLLTVAPGALNKRPEDRGSFDTMIIEQLEKSLKDKIEHVIPCPLSKRQRLLYEDFMASGQTRDTLGSGSFLGIMNVLMQLRKVCNHPDLFEERPIRSPHEMQPLVMQTAGFVLTALDNGPLASEVHLDLLNLNLASYCELDSYDAVRTFTLRTRPQQIGRASCRERV